MNTRNQDSGFVAECKVTVTENGYEIVGNFHAMVPLDVNNELANSELDHVELHIIQLGQRCKRFGYFGDSDCRRKFHNTLMT